MIVLTWTEAAIYTVLLLSAIPAGRWFLHAVDRWVTEQVDDVVDEALRHMPARPARNNCRVIPPVFDVERER